MTEENKKGRLFIVTAPSGAGKTSLIRIIKICSLEKAWDDKNVDSYWNECFGKNFIYTLII